MWTFRKLSVQDEFVYTTAEEFDTVPEFESVCQQKLGVLNEVHVKKPRMSETTSYRSMWSCLKKLKDLCAEVGSVIAIES